LSEEAIQIAEKRREDKGRGEKDTHLNAEFQRIPRRDKKAILSDEYKEIEKNNIAEESKWQLVLKFIPVQTQNK